MIEMSEEPYFYVIGQVDYNYGQVRQARNECLALTAFMMATDSPLDSDKSEELKEYRQALRDITQYDTADEAAENFPSPPDWISDWVRIPE